jgi:hypothetical protein
MNDVALQLVLSTKLLFIRKKKKKKFNKNKNSTLKLREVVRNYLKIRFD